MLITNQVQYLRDTAKVVVMADGKIAEQGTYEELVAKNGKFAELVASSEGEVGNNGDDNAGKGGAADADGDADGSGEGGDGDGIKEIELDLSSESDDSKNKAGKLNAKETMVVGTTPWSVYKKFFRAGGEGGYFTAVFAFVVYFISGIAEVAADAWLAVWSNQGAYNTTDVGNDKQWMNLGERTVGFYIGIYIGLAFTFYGMVTWRSLLMVKVQVNASRYFHKSMLASTLRATMAFFETTPGGQILNRFTRDIYELDFRVMDLWNFAALSTFKVVFSLIYITVVINLFGAFFVVIIILYVLVFEYYRRTARQLQRVEAVTRSPVYNHASETLGGLESIRAYSMQAQYVTLITHRQQFFVFFVFVWLVISRTLVDGLLRGSSYCTSALAGR